MRRIEPIIRLILVGAALGAGPNAFAAGESPAADPFPRACVDCHVARPAENVDYRIGTALRKWQRDVEPALMERLRPLASPSAPLTGRHPALPGSALDDVPNSCVSCHDGTRPPAPRLAPMLHLIHLTGADNHFVGHFGGTCTHCHKLDPATGLWAVPSGPEQADAAQ